MKIMINQEAPDFSLPDLYGKRVKLSDFRSKANVFLIFNRGFN